MAFSYTVPFVSPRASIATRSAIFQARPAAVFMLIVRNVIANRFMRLSDRPLIRQETTSPDPAGSSTVSGFGDPLFRVDVRVLNHNQGGLQLRLAGAWKPPMVDSSDGLGSGETDVAAGGSLFAAAGRTTVFADAMYWKFGDPAGIDFTDTVSYSVGAGRVLGGGRWSTLVSLSGFTDHAGDLTVGVSWRIVR